MSWEKCKWCGGSGCLVCGSTRRQRLERDAALEEARRFLKEIARQLRIDEFQVPPETLSLIAEAIRYGRESAARKLIDEHAAATPDRFEMLEIGEG